MKTRLPLIAILLIAIVVMVLFLTSTKSTKVKSSGSQSENSSPLGTLASDRPAPGQNAIETAALPDRNPASAELQPSNLAAHAGEVAPPPDTATNVPPAILLENIRRAVRRYGDMFGGNPTGTNPEITSALNGSNPKQINFINPEAGMQINATGELTDAWGTPLFFHQLSGTEMEIRSAGLDKKMWTLDDLVTR